MIRASARTSILLFAAAFSASSLATLRRSPAAKACTSTDAAVAALGRKRWRTLHLVGGWYIRIIFAQGYLPRAVAEPPYLPAAAIVLGVPALRMAAWQRRRAPRAASAS